ncbi:ribosomal maturation YjgA family protein [Cellulomonas sp. NPDC055163]
MSRRPALAVAAFLTVAAGLAVRSAAAVDAGGGVASAVAEPVGDALYAVLVYALVGVVAVRARPWVLAVAAWALSSVVEVAQLTGLPAAVVALWDPARWVLGTTFDAPDLVAYAAGAALAALADGAVARAAGPQRARETWASEPPPPAARRSTR